MIPSYQDRILSCRHRLCFVQQQITQNTKQHNPLKQRFKRFASIKSKVLFSKHFASQLILKTLLCNYFEIPLVESGINLWRDSNWGTSFKFTRSENMFQVNNWNNQTNFMCFTRFYLDYCYFRPSILQILSPKFRMWK